MKNGIKMGLMFLSGALLSGITVYAASTYLSKDVTFTPSNSSWEVSNVEEALNDLYENKSISENSNLKYYNSGYSLQGTSASLSGFVVGERYLCTTNMRNKVTTYNISGADVLSGRLAGEMFDGSFTSFLTYFEATSETISFSFSGSRGLYVYCYTIE